MRSKNEMPFIKYSLMMLEKQTIRDYELLVVDSGSTDGSWETAQDFGPQIIYQIKPEEYIPGKVMNAAAAKCSGDILVFNNADCIPQNEYWLENLIKPFRDPEVIAVFGNQITRANANPLIKKDYLRAFGDGHIHAKWRHFFSMATSAVRTSVLKEHPFCEDIQYSEDIEWSWRMKKMGKKIVYVPDAIVEHSHNYKLKQIIKRFTGEGKAEGYIYGEKNRNVLSDIIMPACAETMRDIVFLIKRGEILWIPKAPLFRFLQRYGVWKGKKEFFNTKHV
jgi:rhamnosyltransferase